MDTTKRKKHQVKRQAILRGVSELIADYGLENVSLDQIAKHLEIPKSLLFYYFRNKEELVNETVDYVLDVCREKSFSYIQDTAVPPDRQTFCQYIEKLFFFDQSTEVVPHLRAYYACYNLALRDKSIKEKFFRHQEEIRGKIKNIMLYFAENGIIDLNDAEETADVLYSLIDGLSSSLDFLKDEGRKRKLARQNMLFFLEYLHLPCEEKDEG